MAVLMLGSTDARAAGPKVYGGSIGEDATPFVLELQPPRDLAPIGRVTFGIWVPCPGEVEPLWISVNERIDDPHNIPQGDVLLGSRDARRFSAGGSREMQFGERSGSVEEAVRGRLRRASAAGTFSLTVGLRDARGNALKTCRTGRLKWTARSSPRRIYGGATDDGLAVVIRLDRQRRRVTRTDVGTFLRCPGGGFFNANFFSGPLHAGLFSAGGPYSDDNQRGRDEFRARIRGIRATGTFRDRRTFENGNRCASPRVRWRARSSPRG